MWLIEKYKFVLLLITYVSHNVTLPVKNVLNFNFVYTVCVKEKIPVCILVSKVKLYEYVVNVTNITVVSISEWE